MHIPAENTAVACAPKPGKLESLLREQRISDPALLLRAAILDHATQALTAEAAAIAQRGARALGDIDQSACGSRKVGNQGVLTARQDLPTSRSHRQPKLQSWDMGVSRPSRQAAKVSHCAPVTPLQYRVAIGRSAV